MHILPIFILYTLATTVQAGEIPTPMPTCDELDTCEVCVDTLTEMQELLSDDLVREQVKFLIDLLCNSLPSPADSFCKQFGQDYVDRLIDEFLSQTPEDICESVGLCSAPDHLVNQAPPQPVCTNV